jgi:hypothetical protein
MLHHWMENISCKPNRKRGRTLAIYRFLQLACSDPAIGFARRCLIVLHITSVPMVLQVNRVTATQSAQCLQGSAVSVFQGDGEI